MPVNKPLILYSFRRCPYAMRARMALTYSKIEVELREVKLNDLPSDMLRLSPKATVPVMHLPDGSVLEESLDVIDWALSVRDHEDWRGADDEDLVRENDDVFKPLLDRYKYADRFSQKTQFEHRRSALFFLDKLESRLKNYTYLTGKRLGRVDVAIMPFIRQFAAVEPGWFEQCEYAAVRHWLQGMLDSALFQNVMKKYPLWKHGNEPVYL